MCIIVVVCYRRHPVRDVVTNFVRRRLFDFWSLDGYNHPSPRKGVEKVTTPFFSLK